MPRIQSQQYTFSGGEWSPEMLGRSDVAQYSTACRLVSNFIPRVQGPATRRPGTLFLAETKNNAKAVLVPFVFSITQSYMLEFGDGYFRVFRDRGQVVSGGTPLEIATPYGAADLDELYWTQSADILYLFHPGYRPRKVKRTSDLNWSIEELAFEGGPFLPENTDETIKITPSAATGTVTLTASKALFEAGHVGALWKLRATDLGSVTAWNNGAARTNRVVNESLFYTSSAGGPNGNKAPIHEEGTRSDGAVDWTFESGIFGIVRITNVAGPSSATAQVIERLPSPILSGGTAQWSEGAWSDKRGWPAVGVFHEERLWAGRTTHEPQTVWSTVVGGFGPDKELFNGSEKNGDILADNAITRTLADDQVNAIRAIFSADPLRVLTEGGEWILQASSLGEALTPENVTAVKATSAGSAQVRPIKIDQAVYFVQRAGERLHEMAFNIQADGFRSPDMNELARHMTAAGIARLAYQRQPWSTIWVVSKSGRLLGFTLLREQQVTAWHQHPLGGTEVKMLSVAVTPEPNRDEVWLIVERRVNGLIKRYVEVLSNEYRPMDPNDKSRAVFLDSAIQYDGALKTSFTGAGHLAGETVGVWADGALQPDVTVANDGSFTIDRAAARVTVGLDYAPKSAIETLPLEPGNQSGPSMGFPKAGHRIGIRFVDTLLARYGRPGAMLEAQFRKTSDPLGSSAPLFTGLRSYGAPQGFTDEELVVRFEPVGAAPMTVASYAMQITSNAG